MSSSKSAHRPFTSDQATTRERYGIDAERILIVGHDTTDGAEHPLWRHDAADAADPVMVNSLRKRGQIQPIRVRKLTDEEAAQHPGFVCAAGAGRKRVKAGRVVGLERGKPFLIDAIVLPAGSKAADLIGTANAENYIRVTESLASKVEHMFLQFVAEGADEAAIQSVATDFGVTALHVRQCLALREDDSVMNANAAGQITDTAALALASVPTAARAEKLAAVVANPEIGKADTIREIANREKAVARQMKKTKTDASKPAPVVRSEDVAISISKGSLGRLAANPGKLSRDVVAFLDVVAGKQPPTTVEGLTEALRALGLL